MKAHRLMVAIMALAAVSACDSRKGTDGYAFDGAEWERRAPQVEFVLHPSMADLRKAAPASAHAEGEQLMAWSVVSASGSAPCRVHIVDPRVSYHPEWIGHEVTHCVFGRWHGGDRG